MIVASHPLTRRPVAQLPRFERYPFDGSWKTCHVNADVGPWLSDNGHVLEDFYHIFLNDSLAFHGTTSVWFRLAARIYL